MQISQIFIFVSLFSRLSVLHQQGETNNSVVNSNSKDLDLWFLGFFLEMARGSRSVSSSSKWRYCNPGYYLKRPKRLALLFIVFVSVSFVVWDRQTLVSEHQVGTFLLFQALNCGSDCFVLSDTLFQLLYSNSLTCFEESFIYASL